MGIRNGWSGNRGKQAPENVNNCGLQAHRQVRPYAYRWPNCIVSLPLAGLISSSSSSPWLPTAFSSQLVSSSSSLPAEAGRPCLMDLKRSLNRWAYSSFLEGCSATSGSALGWETGISCLQGMGVRAGIDKVEGYAGTYSFVSAQMRSRFSLWRRSSSGSG